MFPNLPIMSLFRHLLRRLCRCAGGLVLLAALVPAVEAAPMVAAGASYSLALRSDGTVWGWGSNTYGQIGGSAGGQRTTPSAIAGLAGIVQIAAGGYHGVALDAAGAVWTWGYNAYGQLGDGTAGNRATPARVPGLSGIVQISAGTFHTLALDSAGNVWSWGANFAGQLGNGMAVGGSGCQIFLCASVPQWVPGLSGATRVAAGGNQSFALLADGSVRGWGENHAAQLGDGSQSSRPEPVRIGTLSGITQIASGGFHTLSLSGSRQLHAWGTGQQGQLGDGSLVTRAAPGVLGQPGDTIQIAAGEAHSVALIADGSLRAWGYNADGQLGDGTRNPRATPVWVYGLPFPAVHVAAGARHTLALLQDGSVWAWGSNDSGQLGGSAASAGIPQAVREGAGGFTTVAPAISDEDCFFSWAESAYRIHFAPAGATTQNLPPYRYRYYAQTNKYLWLSAGDGRVYVLFPAQGPNLVDVGAYTGYVALARAAGCR